jgi:hypothetical protein
MVIIDHKHRSYPLLEREGAVFSVNVLRQDQAEMSNRFAWVKDEDRFEVITTMTTIGYGDVVPVTPLGKVLAGVIGVIGIGMVALPAGLLASGFSDQLHERRREFEQAVGRILASGTISADEGDELRAIRDRLGLSDHQAAEIVRLIARRATVCPHCGEPIGPGGLPDDHSRRRDPQHARS